jgi:hypothetical protein
MNSASTCAAAVAVFIAGGMTGRLLHRAGVNQVVAEDKIAGPSAGNESESKFVNATSETKAVSFDTRIHDLTTATSFFQRSRAIAGVADGMDAAQVRQALEALKTRSLRDAEEIRLRLIERWAELEPGAALQYAETLPKGGEAQHAIAAVIRTWGGNNAKAAEEAVERMAEGFAKSIARDAMASVLAASNPHRAFALLEKARPFYGNITALWIAQLGNDTTRQASYEKLAKRWLETDSDSARAWIATSPLSAEAKQRLLARKP